MDFELVEPLRDLFKDEVRAVGAELGLPEEIVQRQPFPGPGLAVRIVGEVNPENLAKVRGADHIVREEIRRAGLERETWQAFCVLLADVQSVGVMGDGRTYEEPVVVRAVTSEDAMTADWARLPYDVLDRIATRIVREVPGREPGRLRHHQQAPRHDRVGMTHRRGAPSARPSCHPPRWISSLQDSGFPFGATMIASVPLPPVSAGACFTTWFGPRVLGPRAKPFWIGRIVCTGTVVVSFPLVATPIPTANITATRATTSNTFHGNRMVRRTCSVCACIGLAPFVGGPSASTAQ